MEVQKMTLATLKGMNVSMQEMAQAFSVPTPESAPKPAPFSAPTPEAAPSPAPGFADLGQPRASSNPAAQPASPSQPGDSPQAPEPPAQAAAGGVDPLQWWGALTQQFQQIAQAAVADAQTRKGADAAVQPGGPGPAAKPARKGRTPKNRKAP
jgi:hypothetical protein